MRVINLFSAWAARGLTILTALISIPVILDDIGPDQFAAFALIQGLAVWFVLSDFGLGYSIQNDISEKESRGERYSDGIVTLSLILIAICAVMAMVLYYISPMLGPIYLKSVVSMNGQQKTDLFLFATIFLLVTGCFAPAFKIWFAFLKAYWANLIISLSSLISLASIMFVSFSDLDNKLYIYASAFLAPLSFFSFLSLVWHLHRSLVKGGCFKIESLYFVIRKARSFWLLSFFSTLTLSTDYIILSQFVSSEVVAEYSVVLKVFTSVFFVFGSILMILWPEFTRLISNRKYCAVSVLIKKTLVIGGGYLSFSSVVIYWYLDWIVDFLVSDKDFHIQKSIVIVFGVYYLMRVWTDVFATILQSAGEMLLLNKIVPVQAILCIPLQILFVQYVGAVGVVLGLICSFLFTVVWALPLEVKRKYRISII